MKGTRPTTLGGLASEIEGRIPVAGEEIRLEPAGLRIEVMAATDHRVERLRVYPPSVTRSDLGGESAPHRVFR